MYVQFEPPEDLKRFICFFYVMEYSSADEPLQPLLPSGTEIMGWQYAGRWFLRMPQPDHTAIEELILPTYYTVGQQVTSYWLTALDTVTGIIGATLQPGTLWQWLRRPASTYTHCLWDTQTLFAGGLLERAIQRFREAGDTEARLEALIDFYRQASQHIRWERSLVDDALALIYRSKGAIAASTVCRSLHVNERYLQRHFKLRVGVTMQRYIGMMRFNNVFAAIHLQRGSHTMETVALLHNYYDLSHFNKEYKKYFGVAPSAFELDKFTWLQELVSTTPYNLTVQDRYLQEPD